LKHYRMLKKICIFWLSLWIFFTNISWCGLFCKYYFWTSIVNNLKMFSDLHLLSLSFSCMSIIYASSIYSIYYIAILTDTAHCTVHFNRDGIAELDTSIIYTIICILLIQRSVINLHFTGYGRERASLYI
jgi:hypothetical protein